MDDRTRPDATGRGDAASTEELARELARSEERYRRLFDTSGAAIFVLGDDGRFIDFNEVALERYGYTAEELRGMTPAALAAPGLRAAVDGQVTLAAAGSTSFEWRHVTKAGREIPVEIYSRPIEIDGRMQIYAEVRDVTDRRRAERLIAAERDLGLALGEATSLREALERCLATAIEVSGTDCGGVYLVREDGGLDLAIHRGLTAAFVATSTAYAPGSRSAQLVAKGEPIYVEWVKLDTEGADARRAEGLRALAVVPIRDRGTVVASLNVASHSVDDVPTWARAALEDVAGRVGSAIVRARAEESQRLAEQERRSLEEQYRQLQKMEAVGRLAGGVAHDLNNLLTPILAYTELLDDAFDPGDPRLQQIRMVRSAGVRARDLVQQLLAFSRKQTLRFSPVDLNSVISKLAPLLQHTVRENVRLLLSLDPALPAIRGDVGQIEQAIMNLAINAQDAMPEGGALEIETLVVSFDAAQAAAHAGIAPGRYVSMAFTDDGVGMGPAVMEKIFEPFFTTKPVGKGTGLGLATVYGIVQQHGGSVAVRSEVGAGATFRLYFPALVGAAAALAAEEAPGAADRGSRREVVMIAEDDDLVRRLAADALRMQGYTVLTAAGAGECVRILAGHAGPLHALLTDVVMPDMNGKALWDIVSALFPEARPIYMSGYPQEVISEQGVLLADIDFLQKPFTVRGLAAKLREVLDRG